MLIIYNYLDNLASFTRLCSCEHSLAKVYATEAPAHVLPGLSRHCRFCDEPALCSYEHSLGQKRGGRGICARRRPAL
jgi:hypothetical protein